jgi:hypothetical protein
MGTLNAVAFGDSQTITGYPDPIYYSNISSGVVPSPYFVTDGSAALNMTAFTSASSTVDYSYTNEFFADYPYILDCITPAKVSPPNDDPSVFAYRRYITPPTGDPNNYLWMQNNFTYRDSIPGVWPIQDSPSSVTHPGFLSNAGPFLEVPIRNRWLASLGLFTEPTSQEISTIFAPPRYPRHTVNVQSSAHPKTELFHQMYQRRAIRALTYSENVPDPIKIAQNRADIMVAKMHLRALPVLTYVSNDQLVTTIVNGLASNVGVGKTYPTTNAASYAASVMVDVMRHFQQWCSSVPLFSFADLSLGGTKSFLPVYGGGVGRLVRAQTDVKLPVAVVTNLSMLYPTIVTDSGSSMLVTKMIYPALVQQLTPRDFLNSSPTVFQGVLVNPPWSTWNATVAYDYWSLPLGNSQEIMQNVSDEYPLIVNKLVHHPDYNLCSCVNIIVNTSLALQSRKDLIRSFSREAEKGARSSYDRAMELYLRDHDEQLRSMRGTIESPQALAVPEVKIYFEPAVGKLLIDAALNFIIPYFTSGTTDVIAIASLLSLPESLDTHGDSQLVSNKEQILEDTTLDPGGLFNNFNEEIHTFMDATKTLADMSKTSAFAGLALSSMAKHMPGLLAGVMSVVKSQRDRRKFVPEILSFPWGQ